MQVTLTLNCGMGFGWFDDRRGKVGMMECAYDSTMVGFCVQLHNRGLYECQTECFSSTPVTITTATVKQYCPDI